MNSPKRVKALHQKKYRSLNNQFIIEGIRSIHSAIEAKAVINIIFYTSDFSKKNSKTMESFKKTPLKMVSSKEIDNLSPSITSSGILAVCEIPKFQTLNNKKNIIFLDKIADPGNFGTILRSALWFGIDQIAYSPGSIDPYNPKVVRGAMGAHFNISWLGELKLEELKGYKILGSDHRVKYIKPLNIHNQKWAFIMVSEPHGLSKKTHEYLCWQRSFNNC